MFCKYCGKEIDDDSEFCIFCGKSLIGSSITSKKQNIKESNSGNNKKTNAEKNIEKQTEVLSSTKAKVSDEYSEKANDKIFIAEMFIPEINNTEISEQNNQEKSYRKYINNYSDNNSRKNEDKMVYQINEAENVQAKNINTNNVRIIVLVCIIAVVLIVIIFIKNHHEKEESQIEESQYELSVISDQENETSVQVSLIYESSAIIETSEKNNVEKSNIFDDINYSEGNKYIGKWNDNRCSVNISLVRGNKYDISVSWMNSSSQSSKWKMTGFYNNTTGHIEYSDGEKTIEYFDSNMNLQQISAAKDTTGFFTYISDSQMFWHDSEEEWSDVCEFSKVS